MTNKLHTLRYFAAFFILQLMVITLWGCAKPHIRPMEVTAYCGCGHCCSWERGSKKFLKLDVWNLRISKGPNKGKPYSGKTASGTKPAEPHTGLVSGDTLTHPWLIPKRLLLSPLAPFSHDGTIAADTRYYPIGTRMYVPGYGWGTVEDRGSAIKGRDRLDVYYDDHNDALRWGRQKVNVKIEPR